MRKERGKQIPEKSFISRTVLILLVCAALLLGGCASGNGTDSADQSSPGQDSPGAEAAAGTGSGMDTVYEYESYELGARRGENDIYGQIYVPVNAGEKMPAVIISHGFGGNYRVGAPYAEELARRGYVAYCFDFCGGSPGSRSDGSTLGMSVFTGQADLEAVMEMIRGLDFVDKENLFLMGTSQGGAVSAITAADHPEEVRGLVLLYPAFILAERANELFESAEDIPDTYYFMWMDVGRAYFEPLIGYDIYADAARYESDVLILQGDADSIVPQSVAERAAQEYPSAELKILSGAGHGFSGEHRQQAVEYILEYLNTHRAGAEGKQIRMTAGDVEVLITLNTGNRHRMAG